MGKLNRLFLKSYYLDEIRDSDYFNCVKDYCHTKEFNSMKKNIQHGDVSVVQHIYSVSYISYRISRRLKLDRKIVARGALLHDLFYYDWHDPDPSHRLHGFYHPGFALENAKALSKKQGVELTEIEQNIIKRHMFPLTVIPPKHKESLIVCLVDKYVATKEIIICKSPRLKKKFDREISLHKNKGENE